MGGRTRSLRSLALVALVALAVIAVPAVAAAAGATVQGRLTNASTTSALEGVPVELWSYSHAGGWVLADVTISGADGGYVFGDVAPAVYDVEAVEIGYRWGWSYAFLISGTETRTANVALWPIVPTLPAISGSLVDTLTGEPLVGAQVDVYYRYGPALWDVWDRVLTDADGEYEVYGLPPTTFRVGYTLAGYDTQFYSEAATVGAGTDVAYNGSTERGGIDGRLVRVAQPASVSGSVVDAATGLPVAGALVVAKDALTGVRQTNDFTDAAGSFSTAVPDRAMRLETSAAGHDRLIVVTPTLGAGDYPLGTWLGAGVGVPSVAVGGVADGGLYTGDVTPRAWVTTSSVSLTATMDGAPFVLGTSYGVPGEHDLVVAAYDGSGTTTATVHFEIDLPFEAPPAVGFAGLDRSAPIVTISGVSDGGIYAPGVAPTAAADDPGAVLWASMDGAPYALSTPIVGSGEHTLQVAASDAAGNVGWSQVRFTVDATPPTLSVTGVDDGGVHTGAVTPVATTSDPTDVLTAQLDGEEFALGGSVETTGAHVLTVTATDRVGNSTTVSLVFEVVAQPSVLSIGMPSTSVTYPQPVIITGTIQVEPVTLGASSGAEQADPAAAPASYPIRFQSQTDTGWVDIPGLLASASAAGTFSVEWVPSANTILQAVYDGDGVVAASTSAPQRITVAAAVTVSAPSVARARVAFPVRVRLAPAHGSVRVVLRRRVSGVWRAYRSFSLKTVGGVASRSIALPAGEYRVVATHADAGHVVSASRARIVRVR